MPQQSTHPTPSARQPRIFTSSMPRVVTAAVGLGAAFGLGIVFGGTGTARGAPPEPAGTTLQRADARATVLAAVQEKLRLSFHEELAKPEPPHVIQPVAREDRAVLKPKHDVPVDAQTPEIALPPPSDDLLERPLDKPKGESVAKGDAATAPQGGAPRAEPEKKPAPRQDAVTGGDDDEHDGDEGAVVPAHHDPARLQAAMQKVLGDQAPRPTAPVKAFALQMASFPTQKAADDFAKRLRDKGQRPVVVAGDVPGKGPVYRVRIGGFADRERAEQYKSHLGDVPALIVGE